MFYSTNDKKNKVSFEKALLTGLAPDYGLYMVSRKDIPKLSDEEMQGMIGQTYPEIAFRVLRLFLKHEIRDDELRPLLQDAYDESIIPTEVQHVRDLGDAAADLARRHAAVAQRKLEIPAHSHGVVDDRELEHLRDVAPVRLSPGDVDVVEQDAPLGRLQEPRDDVEERRLPAARRAEEVVGPAVLPGEVDPLQRVVVLRGRRLDVGVSQILQDDARHDPSSSPPTRRPSGPNRKARDMSA